MTTATSTKPIDDLPPVIVRPLDEARMLPASFVVGETMHITLPGDMTIEAGVQNPQLWRNAGEKLAIGTLLFIENDSRSLWRWMRVSEKLGDRATGVAHLVLLDIVPAWRGETAAHPVMPGSTWKIRFAGPHRRWEILNAAGLVHRSNIATEREARLQCQQTADNMARARVSSLPPSFGG